MTLSLPPEELITELCKQFYHLKWVTGTGGGMSIRENDLVYIAPSGVQKERMQPEDIFIQNINTKEFIHKPLSYKMSQCYPLFMSCFEKRPKTKACIHTHSIHAVLCTLFAEQSNQDFIELTHLEMIKGIRRGESGTNYDYFDRIRIPIIENTAYEENLKDRLCQVLDEYPETNAVLVRRHGVYVWGESWEKAKTMAECFDYLFECFVKMKQLGFDPAQKPKNCGNDHDCSNI